jgi:hypothetical protein
MRQWSVQGFPSWTHIQDYNQIKLKKEDKEKTAFITPYGIFCYQVMPFGLMNAGATYQRMMQNCLGSQIGQNIQVYIDNVVITTRKKGGFNQ